MTGEDKGTEGLFLEDDPLAERLWNEAALFADAPPRPAKGYSICPWSWLARVRLLLCSEDQLLVAMVLYNECLMRRSRTVPLSNGKLKAIGIGRQTKYRTLSQLKDTGAITIKFENGRAPWVTFRAGARFRAGRGLIPRTRYEPP
jgi:hypothetical protein